MNLTQTLWAIAILNKAADDDVQAFLDGGTRDLLVRAETEW